MANYQRAREEFLLSMAREKRPVPIEVLRAVMRDANTIQRLAIVDCNVGLNERQQRQDARAIARITTRLAPFKVTPVFSGDPRGACVKLKVPSGRTDDWGSTGICVPTRRY